MCFQDNKVQSERAHAVSHYVDGFAQNDDSK